MSYNERMPENEMSENQPDPQELERLIAASFNGNIDETGVQRLNQLLLEDPAAQRRFLSMASIDSDLHFLIARENATRIDNEDFLPEEDKRNRQTHEH